MFSKTLCNRKSRFNLGGTMETVDAVCQRYGVPILSSLTAGDPAWVYDGSTDRLYQDPSITDKVRCYHDIYSILLRDCSTKRAFLQTSLTRYLFFQSIRSNSDRLATFFRPASEQNHAAMFGTYKVKTISMLIHFNPLIIRF